MKISNSKVRQIASNFNVKYSREINQKINSYVYDGEFLESIDLSSQKILKEKMGNKIKKVGLFDNPSIDKSVDENISMAEMNNYSDTNYIDVEIEPVRTRTIYNKSQE
ncbi:MAG: hypothetical protein RSD09_00615 [Bacilli bacterium]